MHNEGFKRTHLCTWSEADANRGTNEVNACLHKVITKLLSETKFTKLIAFADGCGGQNKSKFSILLQNLLLNETALTYVELNITMKGTKGFQPDARFRQVQDVLKSYKTIPCPEEFWRILKSDLPDNFVVERMRSADFRELRVKGKELLDFGLFVRNRVDPKDPLTNISFQNVTQFIISKANRNRLCYRYTLYPDEILKSVPMTKSPELQATLESLKFSEFPAAFPDGFKSIDIKKKKALESFYTQDCGKLGRAHFKTLHFTEETNEQTEKDDEVMVVKCMHTQDRLLMTLDRFLPRKAFSSWFKNRFHRSPTEHEISPNILAVRPESRQCKLSSSNRHSEC